jgi:PII-like signaling protein
VTPLLLPVFIGEDAKFHRRPLHEAVVLKARGFSLRARASCAARWDSATRTASTPRRFCPCQISPLMIDIVDAEEKIRAFPPVLDSMVLRVLITLGKVQVLMFG